MSHAYHGIDINLFPKPVFNFGYSGNDLFFQYHLLNKMIREKQVGKIRWCILELPYYIFNWDQSLSQNMARYMPAYTLLEGEENQFHHLKTKDVIAKYYVYEDMFKRKKSYNSSVTHLGNYIVKDAVYDNINVELSHVWKQYHTDTIKENIEYFKGILQLLKQINNDIQIYIVVFPQNPCFYQPNLNDIDYTKEIFYSTINSIQLKEFEIWDYFRYYEHEKSAFVDDCHLNTIGRRRFTMELVNRIQKNG